MELRDPRAVGPDRGRIESPISWTRRVGGRFGPTIELPAGTYSDDTQLRLSVCRCIRDSGHFDVEAFSKVELPVFLSYELGAGRGTRAAAHGLERRGVRWNTNFYAGRVRYIDGGGNGAAMRIQPHVWAAPEFHPDGYLPNVLRDAVTTHGHPRGVLGAALHALCLGGALRGGSIREPGRWPELAEHLERIPARMAEDPDLAERWLPLWEQPAGVTWSEAAHKCVQEAAGMLNAATRSLASHREMEQTYAELARELGGLDAKTRGAGVSSAVLALWLAWTGRDTPSAALRTAANLRGSDTDTVASMAGALLGAVTADEPPTPVLDSDLHRREAARLDVLRGGGEVEHFAHPDPLHWQAPASLSDVVGGAAKGVAVAGLGLASEQGEVHRGGGNEGVGWQWLSLEFGQTVLIKRRLTLEPLPLHAFPRQRAQAGPAAVDQSTLFDSSPGSPATELPEHVEEGLALLASGDFDERLMGRLLVHYARQRNGRETARAFAELLADALNGSQPAAAPSPGDRQQPPTRGVTSSRGREAQRERL